MAPNKVTVPITVKLCLNSEMFDYFEISIPHGEISRGGFYIPPEFAQVTIFADESKTTEVASYSFEDKNMAKGMINDDLVINITDADILTESAHNLW